MAPQKPKMTLSGLEVVQKVKDEIRAADRLDHLILTHRVGVSFPGTMFSMTFTIELTPGRDGWFIATCPEIAGLVISGANEEDTLTKAELKIRRLVERGWRSGAT
jgi:hypothetical protein